MIQMTCLSTFIAPASAESSGCPDKHCSYCKAGDLSGVLKLVGTISEHNHHVCGSRTRIYSVTLWICLLNRLPFPLNQEIFLKNRYWWRQKASKVRRRLLECKVFCTQKTVFS